MADFGRLRRSLLGSSRADARISREVVEELELHIVMRAEALEREGMTPADARAQARLEFGDLDDATRYCTRVDRSAARRRRRSSLLSEARQDAGHALRILRRAPAFTAATVLTLALAAGASTAVYGVLHAYLVRPLPFTESDRLAWVNAPMPGGFARAPSMEGVDWTGITSLFEAAAVWDLDGFTIPGDQHAESVVGAWVSPGYFQALGVRPAMGRGFTADEYREGAPVVMLSHDLWVRRFAADPDVVGSTITAHSTDRPDEVPLVTIVGVLRAGSGRSSGEKAICCGRFGR